MNEGAGGAAKEVKKNRSQIEAGWLTSGYFI
jgi:hypothetical protein